MDNLSPMMKQYVEMKQMYKNYILMYRLGDFYEMFFEDAMIASKELDIVLTGRDCGLPERAPMCGVPYHSVDNYISRLVEKGYKVSVCEQVRDPKTNDVVGREVVRMITPGTVTDLNMLDAAKNNYIAAVFCDQKKVCTCFIDISTGDIYLSDEYSVKDPSVMNDLGKYAPRELYLNDAAQKLDSVKTYSQTSGCTVTAAEACVDPEGEILRQLGKPVGELGLGQSSLMVQTLGGLFRYLHQTQLCDLTHVCNLTMIGSSSSMELDLFSWRNLEIVETMRSKEKKGSLLGVLDKTKTAMGARLLRHFLEKPSLSVVQITKRQRAVQDFCAKTVERAQIRDALDGVRDIDRLLTKVVYGTINPRDMKNLGESFSRLPEVFSCLKSEAFTAPYLKEILEQGDDLSDITSYIQQAICDTPPLAMKEGGIIRDGFDEKVDSLRHMLRDSKQIMAQLEAREKESTGIKNLKIGYNKIFGYYIEVSNSGKDLVPDTYIRKQTLVNGERYITPELKEIETSLLNANDQVVAREYELYTQLRKFVLDHLDRVKNASACVALIDVLASFAEVAVKNNYVCPVVDNGSVIDIKNGRHPVVEQMAKTEMFIPNDTYLDTDSNRMAVITGPNMAGKSTYMRATALITLMAQIGSFVPASSAVIGVTDKIFTRVGAADDLASGQSTFMVEMNEVAYILKNATKNSLLIFDEIGRGTSTFDGMSIARAVLEYVAEHIRAKSLFATHYHELIALEDSVPGVRNYNIAAKKDGKKILFLRKIIRGGTDDSYGIDVARLAGVPTAVVDRAEEILKTLESENKPVVFQSTPASEQPAELNLFDSDIKDSLIEELQNLDATVLTPIEAMNTLYSLSKRAKEIE